MVFRKIEFFIEGNGPRQRELDLAPWSLNKMSRKAAKHVLFFAISFLIGNTLLSYFIGPTPMDLQFWPGAVVMMFIATMTASLVTNSGRSAWFVGVLVLMVYAIFGMTLYLLPPRVQ